MTQDTELAALIKARDEADERTRESRAELTKAQMAINDWARAQINAALLRQGITPGVSVVRMGLRKTRGIRIVIEQAECLFEGLGHVDPPTMERGALGPNACSTDMWWRAIVNWRNIKKNGEPGLIRDFTVVQGDTAEELAAKIKHVRDIL